MMIFKKVCAGFLAMLVAVGAGGGVEMYHDVVKYHESESIYNRERLTLRVAPEAGVDATTAPPDIKAGRGSELQNLIGENGALCKRCGWRQVAQVYAEVDDQRQAGRVRGLWHFDDGEERCLILHAGTHLYRVSPTDGAWSPIATEPVIEDRMSYGYSMGGRLWIVGAGGFFCYHKPAEAAEAVESAEYILSAVADMEDIYIPLTTHGIPHEGAEVGERRDLDPVNLLTARRTNGMVGVEMPSDTDRLIFRTDGAAALHGDVTVTITVAEEGESGPFERTYELEAKTQYYMELDPEAGGGEHIAYQVLMPRDWQYIENSGGTYQKNGVTAQGVCGFLHNDTGMLELFGCGLDATGALIRNLAAPVADTDNIFVTFASADGDRAELLAGASCGILFGEEGLTDRLLLGGFGGERNRVYYSAPGDPSYFPADNYLTVGSDTAGLLGFSRVSDGTLALHKEGRGQEPVTYYLTMQAESDEATLTYRAIPSVVAGNLSEPLLAPGALCDFYGDPLLLTSRGVMAVVMRQNINTTERQIVERSRSIRALLARMPRERLAEARGVAFGGRYYLAFPDGTCYVADGGATYRDDAGGMQYEWYPWQGVPASAWAVVEDVLYFGTPDGRLCRMLSPHERVETGALYADRTFTAFGEGDVTYNGETGRMTYAPQVLRPRVGDKVRFDFGVYERFLEAGTFDASAGLFTVRDVGGDYRIHDGMRLVADGARAASGLVTGRVYTVRQYDPLWQTFNLLDEAGAFVGARVDERDGVRLVLPLMGEELIVAEVNEASHSVTFKRYEDDETTIRATVLSDMSAAGTVAADPRRLGALLYDTPVEAVWYSKVFDLGDARRYKTLHMLTVATKPGSGRLTVGFETSRDIGAVGSNGAGGLDFGDLDFTDFELSGFMSSYTQRLRVRRANYLRFRFESREAAPCCVHEIVLTYSRTGVIKGGR